VGKPVEAGSRGGVTYLAVSLVVRLSAQVTRRSRASRPRILLVEDIDAVTDVVRESLEGAGFEVDTAVIATEASERLAARRYAAILSDCVLPDLPPLEWLAVARGAAPGTPMVVYSGAVHLDEVHALARKWRVVAVLAKPFSPAEEVGHSCDLMVHQHHPPRARGSEAGWQPPVKPRRRASS
jgi:CheY-like chemotaxis protein